MDESVRRALMHDLLGVLQLGRLGKRKLRVSERDYIASIIRMLAS